MLDREKRENVVIAWMSKELDKRYCNACTNYEFHIHGTCPGNLDIPKSCVVETHLYDYINTKHIPYAIHGLPCKGREYGCYTECDACVLIRRSFVEYPTEEE